MPEPKVAAGTPTEDAQQRVGVPAVSPESAHSQPDERRALEPLLLALMKATGELLQSIRGGAL